MENALPYQIEVCVDNIEDAINAEKNGADQIELCARLDLDGLMPNKTLLDQAFDKLSVPIKPMLRLRGGDFVYNRQEKDALLNSLEILLNFNCKSIVFGALTQKGTVDTAFLEEITSYLGDQVICFHKAIDYTIDILEACSILSSFEKVTEVLSSGAAQTAIEGHTMLNKMNRALRTDQNLIAAGKILPENLSELHNLVNLEYYHGRKIINY